MNFHQSTDLHIKFRQLWTKNMIFVDINKMAFYNKNNVILTLLKKSNLEKEVLLCGNIMEA